MKRYVLTVAAVLSGCVATDVGNPQTDEETSAEIRLQAYEEELPSALTLDDEVTITHAWIAVDATMFKRCEAETADSETDSESEESGESEAPETESDDEQYVSLQEEVVVADLVSGTSFPHPIRLGQPGTTFCGLSFDIRPVGADEAPDGTPPDMLGYAMLVRGARKDGTPFIVRGGFERGVELDGDVQLVPESVDPFFLGFAANTWLSQAELGALGGDVIEIDIDQNVEVYESFLEAVPRSARLFEDDGDGTLSVAETNSPLAIPQE